MESDWDGIVACHQGKLSCSTWNYQRFTIGAYFLRPEGLKTDSTTATVSGVFAGALSSCETVLYVLINSVLLLAIFAERTKNIV